MANADLAGRFFLFDVFSDFKFSSTIIFSSSLFREFHLEKDPTCLFSLAKAMMALQAVYGVIPKVYGKGRAAKQLFDFMARFAR